MPGILDLTGMTVELYAGFTYYLYQITDSTGGGTLIINAGATLIFDDVDGSGFDPESEIFTINFQGTITSLGLVKSTTDEPDYPYLLPMEDTIMAGANGRFMNGIGGIAEDWDISSIEFRDSRVLMRGSRLYQRETIKVEPFVSLAANGAQRVYGTAYNIKAYISRKPTMVLDTQGREVVSSLQLYIPGDSVITVNDKITLTDGSQPVILKIDTSTGPGGAEFFEVVYA